MTKQELAMQYRGQGCNCCQAVVCAYGEEIGLSESTLKRMSSGFGAGMGGMKGPCGALSGAVIVTGLCSKDGSKPTKEAKEILEQFHGMCGATTCEEIKGIESGKVLCACSDCITNAVSILEQLEIG